MENKINYAALSMDEIIFIGRNKEYGAYDLRRSYNENVKRAILGTIFFTAFAVSYQSIFVRLHLIAEKKKIETVVDLSKIETIEIKTPPPAQPHREQTPPEPPKGVVNAATSAALGDKKPVADNQANPDTIAPPDMDVTIANETHAGTKGEAPGLENGTAPTLEMHVAAPPKESEPVSWAEIMPEYPGGEDAMMAFIRNNLRYPAYETEVGIQGKAIVGFVVDEKGKISDVKVVRSVSRGIDQESMRVIKLLPKFSPGMQGGRPVKVKFIIPMDFHLASD